MGLYFFQMCSAEAPDTVTHSTLPTARLGPAGEHSIRQQIMLGSNLTSPTRSLSDLGPNPDPV